MALQGIMFLFCPLLLFKILRRMHGNVFLIQLGFEKWTIFSAHALGEYWKLMNASTVTPMVHRAKVPHLNFPHIKMTIDDIESKTRISRTAIVNMIKNSTHNPNTHREIIARHLPSGDSLPLRVDDLQHFCFEIVSRPMMEWMLGKSYSDQLTSQFYDAMNYYSKNFNPMLLFGLKLDKIHKYAPSGILAKILGITELRRHQCNVESCIESIYDKIASKEFDEAKDGTRKLIDYYREEKLNTFIWLMNSTLWASIHYPTLVLYISILKILEIYGSICNETGINVKQIVKDVLRKYPPAIIPRVMKKDVVLDSATVGILKKGDTIAFSPLEAHSIMKRDVPLLTGSLHEFSCPAINFSIDWITYTIEELMFKRYKTWNFNVKKLPAINYKLVLLHSKEKMSITLSK